MSLYWRKTFLALSAEAMDWVADQGPRVWSGTATWDAILTQACQSAGLRVPPAPTQRQGDLFGEEAP